MVKQIKGDDQPRSSNKNNFSGPLSGSDTTTDSILTCSECNGCKPIDRAENAEGEQLRAPDKQLIPYLTQAALLGLTHKFPPCRGHCCGYLVFIKLHSNNQIIFIETPSLQPIAVEIGGQAAVLEFEPWLAERIIELLDCSKPISGALYSDAIAQAQAEAQGVQS